MTRTSNHDQGPARRRPGAGPRGLPRAAGGRRTASRWSARPPTAPRPTGTGRGAGARRHPDGHPHARHSTAWRPPGLITADEELAGVRILILTTFELDEYVFEAIRAGASGFLLKDTEPADLLRGLRAVAAGEALLAPSVTRRLIEEFAVRSKRTGPNPAAEQVKALTEREREVLALVAAGPDQRGDRRPPGAQPGSPPRPTSAAAWSSSARATGRSWWCWRTSRGWRGRGGWTRSHLHYRVRQPPWPTGVSPCGRRTSTFPSRPAKVQVSDLPRFTDRTTRSHALDKAPKALPGSRSLAQ